MIEKGIETVIKLQTPGLSDRTDLKTASALVNFVVTLPCAWSNKAKNFLQKIINDIGYIRVYRPSLSLFCRLSADCVKLIYESDAASFYVITNSKCGEDASGIIKGGAYGVCDMGGGTTDISILQMVKEKSRCS